MESEPNVEWRTPRLPLWVIVEEFERNRDHMLAQFGEATRQFVELISVTAFVRIVAEVGGRRVYISKSPERLKHVRHLLSEHERRDLSMNFGLEFVDVPSPNGLMTALRPFLCRRLRADGKSVNDIALALCCHRVTVIRNLRPDAAGSKVEERGGRRREPVSG